MSDTVFRYSKPLCPKCNSPKVTVLGEVATCSNCGNVCAEKHLQCITSSVTKKGESDE